MSFLCKVMLPKEGEMEKVEMWKETVVHISIISIQVTQMTKKWHKFVPVLPSYHSWEQLRCAMGTDGNGVTLRRGRGSLTCVGQEWQLEAGAHSKALKPSCHFVAV